MYTSAEIKTLSLKCSLLVEVASKREKMHLERLYIEIRLNKYKIKSIQNIN
jgi:hypothetical protein